MTRVAGGFAFFRYVGPLVDGVYPSQMCGVQISHPVAYGLEKRNILCTLILESIQDGVSLNDS